MVFYLNVLLPQIKNSNKGIAGMISYLKKTSDKDGNCSTTGKPTLSFATERVSLDSKKMDSVVKT